MAYNSDIEWTETTWNPATGCTKVSSGCRFCYAERFAERFRGTPGHPFEQGFDLKLHPDRLQWPYSWKKSRLVFVNSMSDLFHEQIDSGFIERVFLVMEENRRHTFQVLTKRPHRMLEFCAGREIAPNIWLGVSVETEEFLWRVDLLRQIQAETRFLSCEPLLGPLHLDLTGIHWVIAGGESGPGCRPLHPEWVRSIRERCQEQKVPFFFKQWGGVHKNKQGRLLDGRHWNEMPQLEFRYFG